MTLTLPPHRLWLWDHLLSLRRPKAWTEMLWLDSVFRPRYHSDGVVVLLPKKWASTDH